MQFEYYVLNYNWNNQKVITWNIFNNIHVQESTEKAIKKYLRNPKQYCYEEYIGRDVYSSTYGFEALCKEIDSILKNQLWSRREYEISVSDAFVKEVRDIKGHMDVFKSLDDLKDFITESANRTPKLEKWDCYMQCKPNIEIITREVIRQYKEQKKKEKE